MPFDSPLNASAAAPPPWYKAAIFYHADVETFADGTGDGIGDFEGFIDKLDYLSWLGIDAVWLSPFYPTPNRDNGYDVSDHYGIDPRFGSTGAFVRLLREAERRGIRIVADLVINHTSDQHPWFRSARTGPGSPYFPFYVWSDDPAAEAEQEIVFPGYEQSAWQFEPTAGAWFLHHFYHFQPDLNTDCPGVHAEFRDIVDYWQRLGVQGFRIDAAPFLAGDSRDRDHPHDILRDVHDWATERQPDTLLLAEADLPPDELEPYFGADHVNMLFNFYANQFAFLSLAEGNAAPLADAIGRLPQPPPGCGWLNFLRHHDELTLSQLDTRQRQRIYETFGPEPRMQIFGRGLRRRLAPMLEGDRTRMELLFSLNFSLPGAPLIYYGDEIGMGENLDLPERQPVRTPMQWSAESPNGGFSSASRDRLVRQLVSDEQFAFPSVNVDDQRSDPASWLNWMRRLIQVRKSAPEIAHGHIGILETDDSAVLAHCTATDAHELILFHNFSREPREIRLRRRLRAPEPIFGEHLGKLIGTSPLRVQLTGHGHFWLRTSRS